MLSEPYKNPLRILGILSESSPRILSEFSHNPLRTHQESFKNPWNILRILSEPSQNPWNLLRILSVSLGQLNLLEMNKIHGRLDSTAHIIYLKISSVKISLRMWQKRSLFWSLREIDGCIFFTYLGGKEDKVMRVESDTFCAPTIH